MPVVQDSVLTSRRLIYACCMASYEARAMVDESFGRLDCAARNKKMALLMEVALHIVLGTPTSTESADDHCFTHEDACYIINKADPHCAICGCEDAAVPTPEPPNCDIVPTHTVDRVIYSLQFLTFIADPANHINGFSFYICSNVGGGTATPGQIGTYSTTLGGFTYITVAEGAVVLNTNSGAYWVNHVFPVLPTQLFPPVLVGSDGMGAYTFVSEWPTQAAGSLRQCIIEMSTDGTTWDQVFSGPESDLAIAFSLTIAEVGYTQARITYIDGACTYQYYDGVVTVESNPPVSGRSMSGGTFTMVSGATPDEYLNPLAQGWTLSFRARWMVNEAPTGFSFPAIQVELGKEAVSNWSVTIVIDPGYLNPTTNQPGRIAIYAYSIIFGFQVVLEGFFAPISAPGGDGAWHTFSFTRDPSSYDSWSANDVKAYIDGVVILMSQQSLLGTYDAGIVAEPSVGVNVYTNADNPNNPVKIDEIYGCDHPASLSEVGSVLVPNLMNTFDATWGRQFWWRIEDTDSNSLVANVTSPVKSSLTCTNGNLDPDTDPSI